MLNMLKTVSLVSVAVLLGACASGPKYADMKDSIPPLASDQGRIYFYRANAMGGAAVQPSIKLNGETVGTSKPGGFFYVDRPPGKYETTCSTEVDRKTTFSLAAGQERYVKTVLGMGILVGHVQPELIDAEEGSVAIQGLHYSPDKSAK